MMHHLSVRLRALQKVISMHQNTDRQIFGHRPVLLGRGLCSDRCEPAEPGRELTREPAREVPAEVGREEPGERVPRDMVSESHPNLELARSTNCCHSGGMIEPMTMVAVLVHATLTGAISSTDSTGSGSAL